MTGRTVYLVSYGSYSDYTIVGVFSARKRALETCAKHNGVTVAEQETVDRLYCHTPSNEAHTRVASESVKVRRAFASNPAIIEEWTLE